MRILSKNGVVTGVPTALEHARLIRAELLSSSDWTQAVDSPLTDSKKAEWATHRQALRDLPTSYTDDDAYTDVVFPTAPT